MRWPWTSRKLLDLAESQLAEARRQVKAAEQLLTVCRVEADIRIREAHEQALAAQLDSKLLIDRIVQMSGQPPIFHPAPNQPTLQNSPKVSPEPATGSTIPAPETRVSFSDVHREARKAIKSGELSLLKGAN